MNGPSGDTDDLESEYDSSSSKVLVIRRRAHSGSLGTLTTRTAKPRLGNLSYPSGGEKKGVAYGSGHPALQRRNDSVKRQSRVRAHGQPTSASRVGTKDAVESTGAHRKESQNAGAVGWARSAAASPGNARKRVDNERLYQSHECTTPQGPSADTQDVIPDSDVEAEHTRVVRKRILESEPKVCDFKDVVRSEGDRPDPQVGKRGSQRFAGEQGSNRKGVLMTGTRRSGGPPSAVGSRSGKRSRESSQTRSKFLNPRKRQRTLSSSRDKPRGKQALRKAESVESELDDEPRIVGKSNFSSADSIRWRRGPFSCGPRESVTTNGASTSYRDIFSQNSFLFSNPRASRTRSGAATRRTNVEDEYEDKDDDEDEDENRASGDDESEFAVDVPESEQEDEPSAATQNGRAGHGTASTGMDASDSDPGIRVLKRRRRIRRLPADASDDSDWQPAIRRSSTTRRALRGSRANRASAPAQDPPSGSSSSDSDSPDPSRSKGRTGAREQSSLLSTYFQRYRDGQHKLTLRKPSGAPKRKRTISGDDDSSSEDSVENQTLLRNRARKKGDARYHEIVVSSSDSDSSDGRSKVPGRRPLQRSGAGTPGSARKSNRNGHRPARGKKELPPETVDLEDDLTEADRKLRLDALEEQSKRIAEELQSMIEASRAGSAVATAAKGRSETSNTTVAGSISPSCTTKDAEVEPSHNPDAKEISTDANVGAKGDTKVVQQIDTSANSPATSRSSPTKPRGMGNASTDETTEITNNSPNSGGVGDSTPAAESSPAANATPDEVVATNLNDPMALCPVSDKRLQPHQIEGVRWFESLDRAGHNGILADEMGLGKTIQALWFIAWLVVHQKRGPHLIIVPLAVVQQWVEEVRSWFGDTVRVYLHTGEAPERYERLADALDRDDFDVVVMSTELAMRDLLRCIGGSSASSISGHNKRALAALRRVEFEYLVIDEAHRLKTPTSKLNVGLRKYKNATRRILLTGTPLSNHLTELWALLNVLNPRIFGDPETFASWFQSPFDDKTPLTKDEKAVIVARMHSILRPFFRRRLREEVCPDFASADEVLVLCPATPLQHTLQAFTRACAEERNGLFMRTVMWDLRRTANCPWTLSRALYDSSSLNSLAAISISSGKFLFLRYALPKLIGAAHRVLIFAQMKEILDMLTELLDLMKVPYARLDGETSKEERANLVDDFNSPNPSSNVFLLSTRAGGVGLNLQSADTVIIFDSDWNPCADLQAVSRIQRIGQTKQVLILRLVTEGQIDEVIVRRARKKLETEAVAVGAGKFSEAFKGADALRVKDIKEVLEGLENMQQRLAEDLSGHDSSAAETSSCAPNPENTGTKSSDEVTLVGPVLQVNGKGTPGKASVEASGTDQQAATSAPTMAASKALTTAEHARLKRFFCTWSKQLSRSPTDVLPDVDQDALLDGLAQDCVPEWLKDSNKHAVFAGLNSESMAAAEIAFRARKNEDENRGGALSRSSRRGRFHQSLAEIGDSSDDYTSSSESASPRARRRRSTAREHYTIESDSDSSFREMSQGYVSNSSVDSDSMKAGPPGRTKRPKSGTGAPGKPLLQAPSTGSALSPQVGVHVIDLTGAADDERTALAAVPAAPFLNTSAVTVGQQKPVSSQEPRTRQPARTVSQIPANGDALRIQNRPAPIIMQHSPHHPSLVGPQRAPHQPSPAHYPTSHAVSAGSARRPQRGPSNTASGDAVRANTSKRQARVPKRGQSGNSRTVRSQVVPARAVASRSRARDAETEPIRLFRSGMASAPPIIMSGFASAMVLESTPAICYEPSQTTPYAHTPTQTQSGLQAPGALPRSNGPTQLGITASTTPGGSRASQSPGAHARQVLPAPTVSTVAVTSPIAPGQRATQALPTLPSPGTTPHGTGGPLNPGTGVLPPLGNRALPTVAAAQVLPRPRVMEVEHISPRLPAGSQTFGTRSPQPYQGRPVVHARHVAPTGAAAHTSNAPQAISALRAGMATQTNKTPPAKTPAQASNAPQVRNAPPVSMAHQVCAVANGKSAPGSSSHSQAGTLAMPTTPASQPDNNRSGGGALGWAPSTANKQ